MFSTFLLWEPQAANRSHSEPFDSQGPLRTELNVVFLLRFSSSLLAFCIGARSAMRPRGVTMCCVRSLHFLRFLEVSGRALGKSTFGIAPMAVCRRNSHSSPPARSSSSNAFYSIIISYLVQILIIVLLNETSFISSAGSMVWCVRTDVRLCTECNVKYNINGDSRMQPTSHHRLSV